MKILETLKALRNLRNELAHHEPIITWDGKKRSENLEEIVKRHGRH